MDEYFEKLTYVASPRATQAVRVFAAGDSECDDATRVESRDTDTDIVELPSYFSKSMLYQKLVNECGYNLCYDNNERNVQGMTIQQHRWQQQLKATTATMLS